MGNFRHCSHSSPPLKTAGFSARSENKITGAMLGLAVGDALGTTLEFEQPGMFIPITDMVGGGPFRLKPGQWTDDTSMALCLAESLVTMKAFNAVDQMQRYVRWWKDGYFSCTGKCFDIGNTTRNSLMRFQETGEAYCPQGDEQRPGNGSIMRLAPVPLFYSKEAFASIEMSGLSSRTTHGTQEAIDACRFMGGLIAAAVNGATKDQLLSPMFSPGGTQYWIDHPFYSEVLEIARGSYKNNEPPDIVSSGYAADTLEAALWAFYKTDNFKAGALLAVNLGLDSDTTGAVYGQIAGAYYGEKGIPSDWVGKLAMLGDIRNITRRLIAMV